MFQHVTSLFRIKITFNFPDSWEPTPPCEDTNNILVLHLAEFSLHAQPGNISLFMHFSNEKAVTSSTFGDKS